MTEAPSFRRNDAMCTSIVFEYTSAALL